jgi:hypothetical protein
MWSVYTCTCTALLAQTDSDEAVTVLVWLDDGGQAPAAPHLALASGQAAIRMNLCTYHLYTLMYVAGI